MKKNGRTNSRPLGRSKTGIPVAGQHHTGSFSKGKTPPLEMLSQETQTSPFVSYPTSPGSEVNNSPSNAQPSSIVNNFYYHGQPGVMTLECGFANQNPAREVGETHLVPRVRVVHESDHRHPMYNYNYNYCSSGAAGCGRYSDNISSASKYRDAECSTLECSEYLWGSGSENSVSNSGYPFNSTISSEEQDNTQQYCSIQ